MKLLILGGTVFLGRHIVEAARSAGHQVTLFNRGRSARDLFPEVECLIGDRQDGLEVLRGRRWDAVIDTCGYLPQIVRASAQLLSTQAARYAFISSASVYEDWSRPNQDESAVVAAPLRSAVGSVTPETYGPLKRACEEVVVEAMPGKALVIRSGLIAGPFDPTDRFTYWPVRMARGGEALAPGDPGRLAQVIDVRDLAAWIVDMCASGKTGTFNACGPAMPMGEVLELCREESDWKTRLTWADDAFLADQGVAPYTDMPLWIPGIDVSFKSDAAREQGLVCRPLRSTIGDTLSWYLAERLGKAQRNGLSPERETRLLEAWRSAQARSTAALES